MSKNYDASSIEWLQGAEAIRAHPGNYAGSIDSGAILHCVKEVVANSIDESSNGFGDTISIEISKDGYVTVADQARGIPVGPHPKHPKVDTLTLIFTELHTGGKSNKNSTGYDSGTGGVHGLGLAVVNALSETLEVWSYRKKWYYQKFKAGKPVTPVARKEAPEVVGHPGNVGTIIRFKADTSILSKGSKLVTSDMITWLKDLSWFASWNKYKGDKLIDRKPIKFVLKVGEKEAVIRRKSLADYFTQTLAAQKLEAVAFDEPFVMQTKNVDVVIGWGSDDGDHFLGLTNVIKNTSGGTHVRAIQKMIQTTFKDYMKRGDKFRPEDLFAGMVGAVNLRIKHPRFSSQDKVKLVSDEAEKIILDDVQAAFVKWCKMNKKGVLDLIERANNLSATNDALKNDRKLAAALKVKKGGKTLLPSKMLVSHTKNPEERELFLVEGDSAKDPCKNASDRRFQEVLPLRGKLPNVLREKKEKKKKDKAVDINETIVDILKATGITPQDGTKSMRVGKIMLLMDADADGGHIASLILSLFVKYAPELFEQGKVYFVDTPLYVHQTRAGVKTYAKDYGGLVKKVGLDKMTSAGSTVTRAKGLGELNADILEDVAFRPGSRSLWQIGPEEAQKRVREIMGDDGQARKDMLGI